MEAYPLHWPVGYSRSVHKKNSQFKSTLGRARDYVKGEVSRLGANQLIISTNIPLKNDGDLRADWSRYKVVDPGVAVYFMRNKQQVCLCCDTYTSVWENLHAIGRTIYALRQIDRAGVSDFLNRTFAGFKELPETTSAETDIWLILGLNVKPDTVDKVHAAYRLKAKEVHPDTPNGDEVS